jgi:putative ABC transport system permease protein
MFRNPILRRIALRNVLRWPGSTALVILGSMIGTAMIAGSLVVNDTTREGSHSLIEQHLGEIDLIVTLPDPERTGDAWFDAELHERISVEQLNAELSRTGSDATVNGALPVIRSRVAAQSFDGESGDLMRVAPQMMVISLDWDRLGEFGDSPQNIPRPEPGGMVVSSELAGAMDLRAGDTLEVFVDERPEAFNVEHIVSTEGIAGHHAIAFSQERGTALINLDDGQRIFTDGRSEINTVLVSNSGAITESHEHSSEVQTAIGALLSGADNRGAFVAFDIKLEALEPSEFGLVFLVMSSFVIAAGVLLLVNIYVMLAEERRSTLGIIRALGMRRGHLVRLFLYEGLVYSLVAALLGVGIGLGMARIAIEWMNRILADGGLDAINFSPAILPSTLLLSGLIGVFLACVTVFATSLRTSQINIVSAIRGQVETPQLTRSWWSVFWPPLVALVGGLIVTLALISDSGIAWLIGPPIALVGIGSALRSLFPSRLALSLAFGSSIAYLWLGMQFLPAVQDELSDGPGIVLVFSLALMLTAIGLVALNLSVVLTPIRWISARSRRIYPAARMALAYPGAHPMRTSLTILMFTVVVFFVTFGQGMLTNFERNYLDPEVMEEVELGGFSAFASMNPGSPVHDLADRVRTADAPEFEEINQVSRLYAMQMHLLDYRQGDYIGTGDWDIADLDAPIRERVMGVDDAFLQRGGTRLALRAPGYETDADVWQAMAEDPTLVVGNLRYLGGQQWSRNRPTIEPGEILRLENPSTGEEYEKRMIGILDEQMMVLTPIGGILVNSAAFVDESSGEVIEPSGYLIGMNSDADHRVIADALEREFVHNGLTVEIIRDWLGLPFWLRMMHVLGAFIYFGLFVGIAGLAIVSVRAVHQRRRDIGTLRAYGFRRGMITGYFIGEALVVAVIGTLVGIACGLLAGYAFYLDEFGGSPDSTFYLPVSGMLWTSGAILIAALVFTIIPAIRASRLSVVEALRPME